MQATKFAWRFDWKYDRSFRQATETVGDHWPHSLQKLHLPEYKAPSNIISNIWSCWI